MSKNYKEYDAKKVEYTSDAKKASGDSQFAKCVESAQLAINDCDGGPDEASNKVYVEIGEGAGDAVNTVPNIPNPDKKDL